MSILVAQAMNIRP